MFTRGFIGRNRRNTPRPLPPGQYLETGFPVLSAGPTPHTNLDTWSFRIEAEAKVLSEWSWNEFVNLTLHDLETDIHCVTKWSKLDTRWRGVMIDTLLENSRIHPKGSHVMAFCDGGYTTNLPLADLVHGKAMVAIEFDGQPLEAQHGGPARLLVPHLYFWKSAKWLRGLRIIAEDTPGFWERYGYHMYGDPWQEQRYSGD